VFDKDSSFDRLFTYFQMFIQVAEILLDQISSLLASGINRMASPLFMDRVDCIGSEDGISVTTLQ
jgi:hypothetical protein